MAEYIERGALIENLNRFAPEHYNALVNQLITKQPAADVIEASELHDFFAEFIKKQNQCIDILEKMAVADLVEVVRCKDCRHYNTSGCSDGWGWCESMNNGTNDYRYCSDGERKENE